MGVGVGVPVGVGVGVDVSMGVIVWLGIGDELPPPPLHPLAAPIAAKQITICNARDSDKETPNMKYVRLPF